MAASLAPAVAQLRLGSRRGKRLVIGQRPVTCSRMPGRNWFLPLRPQSAAAESAKGAFHRWPAGAGVLLFCGVGRIPRDWGGWSCG